jgi:NAD(P)-dependent dehydrogenase (short-subunit alcohol dehydrogenase family)
MADFQQAIVVGASSGIGLALAQALARDGARVALVARRGDELDRACAMINTQGEQHALPYVHDVRQTDEVPALLQRIARDLGGFDLIIYAAGIMPKVAPDEYDTPKDRAIIATNLIGAMAWLNEAARHFAQTRSGVIVGISSVAGDRGRRGNPAYGASKAALTTYLEALRNRLSVRGVTVVTIKPGYVATPLLAGEKLPKFLPVITPERAAQLILADIRQRHEVAYVPATWRPIMQLVRAIPSRLFRRLNI